MGGCVGGSVGGGGCTGGSVGGGGCTGGLVGGGGSVGGFVGGGGSVGGGGFVDIGGADVHVEAGCDVNITEEPEPRDLESLGVELGYWGVCVGSGVSDCVTVGVAEIRGVAVAVSVGVRVGTVAVGKGPIRAWAVPTMAVLVPATFFCSSSPRARVRLKTNPYATAAKPMHNRHSARMIHHRVRFFSGFTFTNLLLCSVFRGGKEDWGGGDL